MCWPVKLLGTACILLHFCISGLIPAYSKRGPATERLSRSRREWTYGDGGGVRPLGVPVGGGIEWFRTRNGLPRCSGAGVAVRSLCLLPEPVLGVDICRWAVAGLLCTRALHLC